MRYLRGDKLAGLEQLHNLDFREIYLQHIDRYAEQLMSHISEFRFDDPKLLCVVSFTHNKYFVHLLKTERLACFTLLPHWITAYICVGSGAMLFGLNVVAFAVNHYSKGEVHLAQLVAVLILNIPSCDRGCWYVFQLTLPTGGSAVAGEHVLPCTGHDIDHSHNAFCFLWHVLDIPYKPGGKQDGLYHIRSMAKN